MLHGCIVSDRTWTDILSPRIGSDVCQERHIEGSIGEPLETSRVGALADYYTDRQRLPIRCGCSLERIVRIAGQTDPGQVRQEGNAQPLFAASVRAISSKRFSF